MTAIGKHFIQAIGLAFSGYLAGWVSVGMPDFPGLYFVAGLFFGIMFIAVNPTMRKTPVGAVGFVVLSTVAYFASTMLVFTKIDLALCATGGSIILVISLASLYRIKLWSALLAIAAGGGLGMLMYDTNIDSGRELARTFAIWQCVVGTILSAGLIPPAEKEQNSS